MEIFRREDDPPAGTIRFDVHPGGRIVLEALEFLRSDFGMIENVR